MKKLIPLLLCLFAGVLHAEQIKLTNRQADELLAALLRLESGLTAVNTTLAADNINELRPKVEAFSKGNLAAQKRLAVTPATRADDAAAVAFLAEVEKNRDAEVTVELQRLSLSDDEITAAKIPPAILAVLRQHLRPMPKK